MRDTLELEVTDEEMAEFMEPGELTPEDKALLADMPPASIMADFIINKDGKANGCLLVWDDEILSRTS